MSEEIAKCELCGEPMPPGETMFKFHGYSGPCPKEPLSSFQKAAEIEASTPITVGAATALNPKHEELAAKLRLTSRTTDGKPEGTAESLQRCMKMLNTYSPKCFPANEHGQVHFARAMTESVADEISAFLKQRIPDDTFRNALKAVLMFHSGEPWTHDRQWDWKEISAGRECTTKVLCDIVREALAGNPR
jgi:hypothetical protein